MTAAAAVVLSACATGGANQAAAKAESFEVTNPIRHALQPVSVPADLKSSSAPEVFEQTLCNRLFEVNKKQVMCSDEVKVFIENRRQSLVLGSTEAAEGDNVDQLLEQLDAPRRINLIAAKAGDALAITVIVQDKAGKTLDRFQVNLKADGADVFERANEAALKIVKLP